MQKVGRHIGVKETKYHVARPEEAKESQAPIEEGAEATKPAHGAGPEHPGGQGQKAGEDVDDIVERVETEKGRKRIIEKTKNTKSDQPQPEQQNSDILHRYQKNP